MKKISLALITLLLCSCGILDDGDDTATYTYQINNETGATVRIIVLDTEEEIPNGSFFECVYSETSNLGFCAGELKIIFIESGTGYLCDIIASNDNSKCFAKDSEVFRSSIEDNIFTETRSRFFEYTLTPELLERAFDLPLNE